METEADDIPPLLPRLETIEEGELREPVSLSLALVNQSMSPVLLSSLLFRANLHSLLFVCLAD